MKWLTPPRIKTCNGDMRRVGIELEFAGLDASTAAKLVRERYGGDLKVVSPHLVELIDSSLGTFAIALDFKYAHPDQGEPQGSFRKALGDIGSTILPLEITCPPTRLDRLAELEPLTDDLRLAGAQGTNQSMFFAFGAQYNPELPTLEINYILSILRSFILLRDWIREDIQVDGTRNALAFATPFPNAWCDEIMKSDYAPVQSGFIDDYLKNNPTRNREVDLLPLLAYLDERRVRQVLPDETIKPRPTFHYRLPNAEVDRPNWQLADDWNRWVFVERLAERPELLMRCASIWREDNANFLVRSWGEKSRLIKDCL